MAHVYRASAKHLAKEYVNVILSHDHEFYNDEARYNYANLLNALGQFHYTSTFNGYVFSCLYDFALRDGVPRIEGLSITDCTTESAVLLVAIHGNVFRVKVTEYANTYDR